MKFTTNLFLTLVMGVAIISMMACGGSSISSAKMGSSDVDSVSYSIGVLIGSQSLPKEFYEELNIPLIAKGIQEGRDSTFTVSLEDANKILQAYSQKIQEEKSAKTLEEGAKYLAENKAKEGVQVTPSGLQYKVINEGTGAKPTMTDKVKVNYRGTYINGEEFDSNVNTEFGVGQVIRGWSEGLQLMSVGSKYEFAIPSELAYGERPPQRSGIPPNSVLLFTVELLDVLPGEGVDPRLGAQ